MRISLESLDARALSLDLGDEERVVVRSATGLGGTLEQQPDRLVLSGARADALVLEALRLVFGDLVLTGAASLTSAGLTLDQRGEHLTLDLDAQSLDAPELALVVDTVAVAGRVELSEVHLSTRDDEGRIEAKHVRFAGFRLQVDDTIVTAETLTASGMAVSWGAAGLRLEASLVEASGVQLALAFSPDAPPDAVAAEAASASDAPLFDWRALDGLEGDINADVSVDVTVPIIGRRQVTHRFRIPVANGALDYRQLESDLSTLENSLLDFAVRDGALVLERGIPLLPTRGHGKPIVMWDLGGDDLALAEHNRVRLAVLPNARLAGDSPAEGDETPSAFALRRLGIVTETKISLAPVAREIAGQLQPRSVGSLALAGEVFHDAEGAKREGLLRGELLDLDAALCGLALGTSRLDVGRLRIAHATSFEISFVDVSPRQARLAIDAMSLASVTLR